MEQSGNRGKIERWLDLLDGGRAANPGWDFVVVGFVLLGFMIFAMVVEQVGPGSSLSILAYLLSGASIILRGVASLLQERRETLATSLRLLCVAGWAAVVAVLGISFYSSFGLPGVLIGLSLLAGGGLLSIRRNRKRLQSEQPS